jgi:hypothetical protein
MIGVGPLESMVFQHGERAVDLIEPAADKNATLVAAMRHLWASDDPARQRIDRYLRSPDGPDTDERQRAR